METRRFAWSGSDGRSSVIVRGTGNSSNVEIKLITAQPDIEPSIAVNRIKVVSEVAELVPILRAVDSDVKSDVFKEVSAGWKSVREIEEKSAPRERTPFGSSRK